jgi:YVTN family beta-propeller protein
MIGLSGLMISAFEKSGGRRLRHAAVVLLLGVVEVACNENYRPIVQPVLPPPPNPAAVHFVFSLSSNGPLDPGSVSRIDVSGDTYSAVFNTGVAPAYAALNPSGTKLYVANSGEDTVSVNSSGTPGTISLPGGYEPVFVHSRESGNMYVANYGNNTVSQINTTSDVVIGTVAVGTHPVAMAEMPNGQKLYVVNQGSGTVSSINILGFGVGKTIPVGSAPVWAAARSDNAKIYILDNSGAIYEIDTPSDTAALVSTSMGAGANYMALDPTIQRLYVTNPTNGRVGIFDVSGTLNQLAVIDLSQGANAPCPNGCSPVSVTGIGDGSRAYVASYQLTSCTDPLGNPYACVKTQVEVLNTGSNTISKVIPIKTVPVDTTNPTGCGAASGPPAAVPWTPGTARFRAFAASSGGGNTSNFKVYVSQCDAGGIAVIDTTAVSTGSNPHAADVYTVSLAAPLSSFPPLQASISGADFSSGTTTYTYTPATLGLQVGMKIFVTGMSDNVNNGNFAITELATGTSCSPTAASTTTCFVAANSGGVTATAQSGSGTVLPPQNPVLVVAGP